MTNKPWLLYVLQITALLNGYSTTNTAEDFKDSGDLNNEDSSESIGATVTQVARHPYVATLLKNDTYICSAVILNNYWLLTVSKCFDPSVILSYTSYSHLKNYSVRVGSSYNNKGGTLHKMRMMTHYFDMRITAIKVQAPLTFNSRVQAVQLPNSEEDLKLGYLVSIVAWTPIGHVRLVNAPAMEPSICESYTKLRPGQFICVGGVQDPDRHFCRKDNGGAIVQNNTLVGISSFVLECAHYAKAHAFPKVSSFIHWIDTTVWDEDNRPSSTTAAATMPSHAPSQEPTDHATDRDLSGGNYADPSRFMLTLPFDPINVPLEPGQDNSVIPRMSLYESYIQNIAREKTSTTPNPKLNVLKMKKAWVNRFNKAMMLNYPKKYDQYEYN